MVFVYCVKRSFLMITDVFFYIYDQVSVIQNAEKLFIVTKLPVNILAK